MAFSINDFRNTFVNGIPAKQNLFEFRITSFPQVLGRFRAMREMPMRCRSASIPGKALDTAERVTNGHTRNVAFKKSLEPMAIEIIEDDRFDYKKFFDEWQEYIVKDDEFARPLEYYNNYIGEAEVTQLDLGGNIIHTVELREIFPISVQSMPLAWGSEDFHVVSVEFQYKLWRLK